MTNRERHNPAEIKKGDHAVYQSMYFIVTEPPDAKGFVKMKPWDGGPEISVNRELITIVAKDPELAAAARRSGIAN